MCVGDVHVCVCVVGVCVWVGVRVRVSACVQIIADCSFHSVLYKNNIRTIHPSVLIPLPSLLKM